MDITEFESTPLASQIPEAIQRYLGLRSLEDILEASNADGVARLLACPPFEPFEALTLTFFDGQLHASHVVSDEGAWGCIACRETMADDSRFIARQRTFEIPDCPTEMQGWRRMADTLERAVSCMSDNPDGISFYHLALGSGVDSMRVWFNPTGGANALQCCLIEGYMRIKARLQPA